ncbi:hypothetical protein PUR28_27890 [Streptomyces sp. BE308]|uniref:hypothetical protein n=1 Tax=Streptomyces sp. BE308 TaxID=3002529 RepID=UPI002E790CD7|nr:hypothetical protein [Streptomyces sp. BE308]MEE1794550.1 hypothetical protein [Streptomyces sp. BE308]
MGGRPRETGAPGALRSGDIVDDGTTGRGAHLRRSRHRTMTDREGQVVLPDRTVLPADQVRTRPTAYLDYQDHR